MFSMTVLTSAISFCGVIFKNFDFAVTNDKRRGTLQRKYLMSYFMSLRQETSSVFTSDEFKNGSLQIANLISCAWDTVQTNLT